MATAFVSYAFNLNLGAIIGAAGFRHRLYSRFGVRGGAINRIVDFSILTNWLGFLALGGVVLIAGDLDLPLEWSSRPGALRLAGVTMLLVVAWYVALCAWARWRTIRFRGTEIVLPTGRLALTQLVVSSASWVMVAAVVYTLLRARVPFVTVLGVHLFAAVAAVIVHVPAGLGVIETVYIAALGHAVPQSEIIGALIAFRGVYYIVPLVLAIAVYLLLEGRTGRARSLPPMKAPSPEAVTNARASGRAR